MRLKAILVSVLVALLAGCKYDLPAVDSGSFELHYDGGVKKGELAQFQVEALSDWLRARRTGWAYKIEDRAPALHVFFKREGVTLVMVYIGRNSVAVGELVRPIAPQERETLVAILAGFLMDETDVNRLLQPARKPITDRADANAEASTRFADLSPVR